LREVVMEANRWLATTLRSLPASVNRGPRTLGRARDRSKRFRSTRRRGRWLRYRHARRDQTRQEGRRGQDEHQDYYREGVRPAADASQWRQQASEAELHGTHEG